MKTFPLTTTLFVLLVFVQIGQADPLDTWNLSNPLPTQKALYNVVYGNGKFVAVGDAGIVLTSEDGVKWDQHLAQQPEGLTRLIDVVYGNGQFVAAGVFGFNEGSGIQTSVDGVTWVERQSAEVLTRAIAYGNGLFVAVGFDGVQTSADGMNWLKVPSAATNGLYGIVYGNGQFVAVGETIQTSADGMSWVQRSSKTQEYLLGIAYGGGHFVAVGDRVHGSPGDWSYESIIVTSADGATWVQREPGTTDGILRRVAYGNDQFVAVGDMTTILTSADGVKWVQHESSPSWLSGITYGNGHFVAVGNSGTILQSGRIITLSAIKNTNTGLLTLSLSGPTGLVYTIQVSSDLMSWQNLTDITSAEPTSFISRVVPVGADHLFYRASSR